VIQRLEAQNAAPKPADASPAKAATTKGG
jgi:hypothetical protein